MIDIGPEAPVAHGNSSALGMFAKQAALKASLPRPIALRFRGQKGDGLF